MIRRIDLLSPLPSLPSDRIGTAMFVLARSGYRSTEIICIHNHQSSPQVRLVNSWLARLVNRFLCLKFDYNWKDDIIDLKAASQIFTSFIARLKYRRRFDFLVPLQLWGSFFSTVGIPKTPSSFNLVSLDFIPPDRTNNVLVHTSTRLESVPHISKLTSSKLGWCWCLQPSNACTIPTTDSSRNQL